MDNSLFAQIETLGGKVYFFGECVWATQLKIKLRHYKIAILHCTPETVIPLLDRYEIQPVKQTLQFKDNGVLYELYFPKDLWQVPLDPIPVNNAILGLDGKVYRDPDLKTKIITADPIIFLDYPQEMLRVCRIAAQTGFKIDVLTWVKILEHSRLIKTTVKNNPRYVGWQLYDIIMSNNPDIGLQYLWELGLLRYILPELDRCHEISQTRRGENTNVLTHTMLALRAAEQKDIIRWCMLFHDMAKPLTMEITNDGKMHFFKHEFTGATLAEHYMKQFGIQSETIQTVKTLIENHMFDADPKLTQKGVRRLIRRVGKDLIFDLLRVREADRCGSPTPPSNTKIDFLRQKVIEEYENV